MGDIQNVDMMTPFLDVLGQVLAWTPIVFIITLVVGLFAVRHILTAIRRGVTGSSGMAGSEDNYQRDMMLFFPLWWFQGPVIPLPTVSDTDIGGVIGQVLGWSPVTYFLTAIIAVAVISILLRAFRKAVSD